MSRRFTINEFSEIKSINCSRCLAPAVLAKAHSTGRWMVLDKYPDPGYDRGHYYQYHECKEQRA